MLYAFDPVITDFIKICAFGEELPQQTIGVFIRSTFPGAMRMGKVNLHLRVLGKQLVFGHLYALVVRHR